MNSKKMKFMKFIQTFECYNIPLNFDFWQIKIVKIFLEEV